MNVLCAYTDLHPAARSALLEYAPEVRFVDVTDNEFGYRDAIAARWTGVEDLLLVEHDIEIHKNVFRSLGSCANPWCVFPYQHMTLDNWLDRGLGCTRFSANLQMAIPFEEILSSPAPVPGSWRHLDGQIAETLEGHGIERCVHHPPVTHWNRHLR